MYPRNMGCAAEKQAVPLQHGLCRCNTGCTGAELLATSGEIRRLRCGLRPARRCGLRPAGAAVTAAGAALGDAVLGGTGAI